MNQLITNNNDGGRSFILTNPFRSIRNRGLTDYLLAATMRLTKE